MPALAEPATHTVVMKAMAFVPQTLTVTKGDTVVWVNEDLFSHTATAAGSGFDSGEVVPKKTFRYVADKRGTFAYVCTLHPTMKGTLVVE